MASLVESKPGDVRCACGIGKWHSLVCHIDEIAVHSEAHRMRTAGPKRRADDRLKSAERSNFKDRNRIAARIYCKKVLPVNAKRPLRVEIAAVRDHEALPAGRKRRSHYFGKRAVCHTVKNHDAI